MSKRFRKVWLPKTGATRWLEITLKSLLENLTWKTGTAKAPAENSV